MTMSLSSKCLTTGIFLVPGKKIYPAIFLATQEIRGKLLHGDALKLRSPWVFTWTSGWSVSKWQFWRKCCPRTGGQRLSEESRGRFTEKSSSSVGGSSLSRVSSKVLLLLLILYCFLKKALPNCISLQPYKMQRHPGLKRNQLVWSRKNQGLLEGE